MEPIDDTKFAALEGLFSEINKILENKGLSGTVSVSRDAAGKLKFTLVSHELGITTEYAPEESNT
jgi:hypothetical protein